MAALFQVTFWNMLLAILSERGCCRQTMELFGRGGEQLGRTNSQTIWNVSVNVRTRSYVTFGPWWWSSGLLWRSVFESRWSLQFFYLKLCLKRTKINKKDAGVGPFLKKSFWYFLNSLAYHFGWSCSSFFYLGKELQVCLFNKYVNIYIDDLGVHHQHHYVETRWT